MTTPFCAVEGWDFGIRNGGASKGALQDIGPRGRMHAGSVRRGERARIRPWRLETPILDEDTAEAVENLIAGNGWSWTFDTYGLTSDASGLGANAGYNAALITSAPTPKFGTRALNVSTSGGSVSWTVTLLADSTWSVAFWHNFNNATPGANAWDHYCITSDAGTYRAYKNGALTYGPSASPPTAPLNLTWSVSGTTATFSLRGKKTDGTNTTAAYFDDLVILPWLAPAGLVAAIAASTSSFGPLPFLKVSGDIIREAGPVICSGQVLEQPYSQGVQNGAWAPNNRNVSFTLEERTPR